MGAKKSGREADTPALLFGLLLGCETVLSDNGPDNPCCYLASLLPASVPFLSGGFATHSPRERVWERIGKEWVIDKSLLDFVFSYLYLYFIALDFPTSVFRCRIIRQRKCQQRQKGQGTFICALPFIVHIVPRRVLSF